MRMNIISKVIRRTFLIVTKLIKYMPFCTRLRGFCYGFVLKKIGKGTNIADGVTILDPPNVSIGSGVSIHPYTFIGGGKIEIGNYARIAPHCSIVADRHNFSKRNIPIKFQGVAKKSVKIGDDVWLGSHTVILADVGTGSIIGAGSVVTREIPPYSVAYGNPARARRQR